MAKVGGIRQVKYVNGRLISAAKNAPESFSVFIAGGKSVDKKVAAAQRTIDKGVLFIKNKLSQKSAAAVNAVQNFVESQSAFNMSLRQNYSKNTVEMCLLGKSYGVYSRKPEKNGYQVFQQREIPVTSAVNTYLKTAREMYSADLELRKVSYHRCYQENKSTFTDRLKTLLGIN